MNIFKRGIHMRKKAQGLSITTIIVAAIALIVLVVLVAIFTGRIGGFSSGIDGVGDPTKFCGTAEDTSGDNSNNNGGNCKVQCGSGEISVVSRPCPDPGEVCCK